MRRQVSSVQAERDALKLEVESSAGKVATLESRLAGIDAACAAARGERQAEAEARLAAEEERNGAERRMEEAEKRMEEAHVREVVLRQVLSPLPPATPITTIPPLPLGLEGLLVLEAERKRSAGGSSGRGEAAGGGCVVRGSGERAGAEGGGAGVRARGGTAARRLAPAAQRRRRPGHRTCAADQRSSRDPRSTRRQPGKLTPGPASRVCVTDQHQPASLTSMGCGCV